MVESDLRQKFFEFANQIIAKYNLKTENFHPKISTANVLQEAVTIYRNDFNEFMKYVIEKNSKIEGIENLIHLHELSKQGKSCLILSRHVGNFDVPNLYYLVCNSGNQEAIKAFDDIIFIAGRKLNEEHSVVLFFSSIFPRIVIIPKGEEIPESTAINMAAQRVIKKIKTEGKILYLYPTGTRERSWDTNSMKGIKETYNYIKSFDNVVFQNIEGNNLIPSKEGMLHDEMICDTIIFKFSPVYNSHEILNDFMKDMPADADKKQFVVDKIMDKIRGL